MLEKIKIADSYKNISCLIGHVFQEIHPPCNSCNDDTNCIVLSGIGQDGKEVKLLIRNQGIYEVYGSEETLEKIDSIRTCRCFNGRK